LKKIGIPLSFFMKRISLFLLVLGLGFTFAENKEWCGTQEAVRLFKSGIKLARPTLSGPESCIVRTNFRVHYTTSGSDATTPAYAESTANYIEYSWRKQVDTLGWIAPPPDGGEGGDDRYDIYIQGLQEGIMGYCAPESYYPNPYPDGATSYIGIDNNLSFRDLRIVCAHEFNHASQNRYSYLEGNWWQENCATWMEDVCYDEINQYLDYFNWSIDPLDSPHKPITCDEDLYEYAGCLWPMFLAERYGINCPRIAWVKMGEISGENTISGINSALANFSANLTNALKEYGVWRYFTGSRADTTYHFSESNLMPTSRILRSHSSYPASGDQGSYAPSGPGGTNYIQFSSGGTNYLRTIFDGQDSYLWSASAIGYKAPPSDTYEFILNYPQARGFRTVPFSTHSHIALVTTVSQWESPANNLNFAYNCSLKTMVYNRDVGIAAILSPPERVKRDSQFSPRVLVENYGQTSASFLVKFAIFHPSAETIYQDSASVNNLPRDGWQEVQFRPTNISQIGSYSVIAQTKFNDDEYPNNDQLTKSLNIYSPITGWERIAEVPLSPDGKRVKSGGGMAIIDDTTIFILKGNNQPSLYRFNPRNNSITFIGTLRYGGEDLKVKRGGFLLAGGDYLFFVPGGNKNFFYRSLKTAPLSLTALDQIPGVGLKGGTGMVYCEKGGDGYIYLLKGSKSRDFYLYDVKNGNWQVKQPAPVYASPDKGYPIGSGITFDGNRTIYCLRAKYNELYKYDIVGDTWYSRFIQILPFIHPAVGRKKYVKEGGAIAYGSDKVYFFKGGNSNEFWAFDIVNNSWLPLQFLPSGSENKGVKGGGFLIYHKGYLFALKGNNTSGIWRYTGEELLARGSIFLDELPIKRREEKGRFNLFSGEIKIYDSSGRLINLSNKLAPGIYIIERSEGGKERKKVVVVR